MLNSTILERHVCVPKFYTRQFKESCAQATLNRNTSTRRQFRPFLCAEQHARNTHENIPGAIVAKSSVIFRRLALTAVGLKALTFSTTSSELLQKVFGAGGGNNGRGGFSFGGDGGGGHDPIFGVQPVYARVDEEYEEDIYDEDEDEEGDEEDDYDSEDGVVTEDSDGESRGDNSETRLKKPKSKDSFVCESVLATNLPTGPGIPTKVSELSVRDF